MTKETVAIIGMGFMGGSLGKAIKVRALPYRVLGIGRNSKRLNRAMVLGACDAMTVEMEVGVKEADIVVCATPVETIAPTVKQISATLKKGATITDIGSVKAPIIEAVGADGANFIGGHPLCGSEKTGIEYIQQDLYKGATVVLTPTEANSKESIGRIKNFWQRVGASVLVMEPQVHDVLVAQTSHLPHILAAALIQLTHRLQKQDPRVKELLAGSFKDMTRISDSDPLQWSQIVRGNEKFVLGALQSYRDILTNLIQQIEKGEETAQIWNSFFEEARTSRRDLLTKNN